MLVRDRKLAFSLITSVLVLSINAFVVVSDTSYPPGRNWLANGDSNPAESSRPELSPNHTGVGSRHRA